MNIVLIGIQGSGKGTVIEKLKNSFDFSLISTGQLLRDEIASGSTLGKELKSTIDKGELVKTDIIINIIKNRLDNDCKDMIIFDGYPRSQEQAEELDKICNIDLAIHLHITKQTAISRILNRLTCSQCGYVTNKSSVRSNSCPKCNGDLVQRADDNIDAIEQRFSIYETETYPLIERYKKLGVLAEVDASQKPDDVCADVLKVIRDYNKK